MDSLPCGPPSRGDKCRCMIPTCEELGVKSGVCVPVSVSDIHACGREYAEKGSGKKKEECLYGSGI